MEGTESGTLSRKPTAPTKRALIIESWERLGCTMVGEVELRDIQLAVRRQLGPGVEMSPAAIARVLADQGAELRHPEVIEFDARWREAKIETDSRQLKGLDELLTARPLQLKKAEVLIKKLEKLRQRAETSGDQAALHQVRTVAVNGRQQAELLAKDRKLSQEERAEQAEIVEWLKLWIQTPGLFADWLELRRRSPEFQKKFSG
ncbi:MAG: hypothetical protein QOH42_1857 [Blastocatellia bacterium]|jgi:hypothetical protein|nr:hypothetical protein [Blastocatellia bacterium]